LNGPLLDSKALVSPLPWTTVHFKLIDHNPDAAIGGTSADLRGIDAESALLAISANQP
jgi:hypothetical protein